jgi:ABC-type multidrug transport system fused ATPase/permease subunit
MERLMHSRTAFIIAHRPSAVKNCAVLLVIENGRLDAVTSDPPAALKDSLVPEEREATESVKRER